jgi:hypothetical protein
MKRTALIAVALLVLAWVAAPVAVTLAGEKSHDLKAEIVSVDPAGKTLTFKDETGQTNTAAALGKAIDSLKSLKAGDKVILTCSDNDKGEHQGISAIRYEKPPAQ